MELLFIRHAETETNIKKLVHRVNDESRLTELGKKQAERVASVCKQHKVKKLYTSPEIRALETAIIIGKEIYLKPIVLNNLIERNWGNWSGKSWEEIKEKLDKMSLEERYTFNPPRGESWQQMDNRLNNALQEIIKTSEPSAIVMHGGAMRALIPVLINSPRETSFKYDFANASITIFQFENGIFRQELVNDQSHLE